MQKAVAHIAFGNRQHKLLVTSAQAAPFNRRPGFGAGCADVVLNEFANFNLKSKKLRKRPKRREGLNAIRKSGSGVQLSEAGNEGTCWNPFRENNAAETEACKETARWILA